MNTFEHARRLGAGAILTDGKRRFRISDWSPSSGAVYGWEQLPSGGEGRYARLPHSLKPVEEIGHEG